MKGKTKEQMEEFFGVKIEVREPDASTGEP